MIYQIDRSIIAAQDATDDKLQGNYDWNTIHAIMSAIRKIAAAVQIQLKENS